MSVGWTAGTVTADIRYGRIYNMCPIKQLWKQDGRLPWPRETQYMLFFKWWYPNWNLKEYFRFEEMMVQIVFWEWSKWSCLVLSSGTSKDGGQVFISILMSGMILHRYTQFCVDQFSDQQFSTSWYLLMSKIFSLFVQPWKWF